MISLPREAIARIFSSMRLEQTTTDASLIILRRLSLSSPQPKINLRCFSPALSIESFMFSDPVQSVQATPTLVSSGREVRRMRVSRLVSTMSPLVRLRRDFFYPCVRFPSINVPLVPLQEWRSCILTPNDSLQGYRLYALPDGRGSRSRQDYLRKPWRQPG